MLTIPFWKEHRPTWYRAAERYAKNPNATIQSILAVILLPPYMDNTLRRNKCYKKLASFAGYTEREPLPNHIVDAVRKVFPSNDGKYTGFKAK
jgi:hypothetical protein